MMEEALGHARGIEKELGLAEVPHEPLEGSAEKHIPVLDSPEEEEAYKAF